MLAGEGVPVDLVALPRRGPPVQVPDVPAINRGVPVDWTPLTKDIPVRASIGLISAMAESWDQTELLAAADRNVYAAKTNGRDQIVVTDWTGVPTP